jgi:2-aminomuconate deaminase
MTDETHPALVHAVDAAGPVGPYPHARWAGGLLFLSGIGPRRPGSDTIPGVTLGPDGSVIARDIEVQARAVFANVRAILDAAGVPWSAIADVTCFMTDLAEDFPVVNSVWADVFPEPTERPTRTTVEVRRLPTPIAIELKVIAAPGEGR